MYVYSMIPYRVLSELVNDYWYRREFGMRLPVLYFGLDETTVLTLLHRSTGMYITVPAVAGIRRI